jgi:5-methylcytosine-specific restriction endonuclease McrA
MSAIHRHPRWPALRLAAKRRDRWACVKCGSRLRLEVDHVEPATRRPDLLLALGNLQTLCRSCHIDKTRHEQAAAFCPKRAAWRDAVSALVVKAG